MLESSRIYLQSLLEAEAPSSAKKLVVVYGGRFQPFHKGHFDCYQRLCKKFGEENVWIATSDKTNFDPKNGDVSPFDFEEKKQIITTLYDLEPARIIKSKNPAFNPAEVFKQYKGYRVVYVAACGRKDQKRYVNDFFKPLPTDLSLPDQTAELLALDEKTGYYVEIPMRADGLSGTVVRQELLAAGDDKKARRALFKRYFGRYDAGIDALIVARLKEVR